ncbi:MAG TPA: LuxR C-terminal-related transcriptional regulator [Rubrivivax sp.]|nr:LuxR C-terminal-related transcriptional regulator [Rubrivivax sp.]
MHPRITPPLEDRVVAGLYRAAAGDRPWGEPLADMVQLFGAWGVHLHGVRLTDGAVGFSYEVGPGFTPEGALEYLQRWHRIDPRAALVAPCQTGEWISCHEQFDDDFVARDPFYRDFLMAYGGRWVSGGKVYQDDEVLAILGIHRGRTSRPLDAAELALGQRIGEHMHCALGLWRRQRQAIQDSLFGNALLARLGHAVLLVDEQLQVHYKNAAANQLLQHDKRLKESGRSLVCAGPGSADALLLALRRMRLGGDGSWLESGPTQQRAVVRAGGSDGKPPLLLLLSALRPDETMGAFGPRSLAMVLLHDPGAKRRHDPFVVAAMYDLTPAEAKVAVAVAEGAEVSEIARSHGVAVATVRSQLHAVFAKMGISRQSEVVGALASIPSFDRPVGR